jgi:hypothetical protein
MTIDRSVRSLVGLQSASSSRVLNLAAIAIGQKEGEGQSRPLFRSKIINRSIILKHRLRPDEFDAFQERCANATKIIIPFEILDLRSGGQSIFVGQRGFEDALEELGNYSDPGDLARDIETLQLLDAVPSLDPFLLREHLRAHEIAPDSCYFAIAQADQQRMRDHAAKEVGRLTAIAMRGSRGGHDGSTSRMVAALLSSEVNEKLEPLRVTLSLSPSEFAEGVFSWRGFLYYKWSLTEFWPQLMQVLREIRKIQPVTRMSCDQAIYLENAKVAIIRGVKQESASVRKILGFYDDAYSRMVESTDPNTFRQFLLCAPAYFVEIGEKIGAMSHIASFWRYRFPLNARFSADADELIAIFQDFARSCSSELSEAA